MSAVSYLASYLSRAKFLSATYVATALERLVNNLCHLQLNPLNMCIYLLGWYIYL